MASNQVTNTRNLLEHSQAHGGKPDQNLQRLKKRNIVPTKNNRQPRNQVDHSRAMYNIIVLATTVHLLP